MAIEVPKEARKGDPITAEAWNALQAEVRSLRLLMESVLRARPGSLGAVHVRTPAEGIDAAVDEDTPSYADCMVRVFDGTNLIDGNFTVRVYNRGGAIAGDMDIQAIPHQNKPGLLFAAVVYCYMAPAP